MARNAFLFPEMEQDEQEKLDRARNRQTWFLLVHRDLAAGELRCELSMPISMSADRHVDGWRERILLQVTNFDAALLLGIPDGPDDPLDMTEEVQIDLRRRGE